MRIDRSSRSTVNAIAAIRTTKPPSSTIFAPAPLPSPENNSESRTIVAMSEMDAAAITIWPNCVDASPLSFRTGITIPSDVAESMIAISSGAPVTPAASSITPAPTATANEKTKLSAVIRSSRPRSMSNSTSSPARSRRNARPRRERTSTGASTWTQPRAAGPIAIPRTISSTTVGSRTDGARPSASGAANAAAATIARLVNETSTSHRLSRCAVRYGPRRRLRRRLEEARALPASTSNPQPPPASDAQH